jgi:hypothetical protein
VTGGADRWSSCSGEAGARPGQCAPAWASRVLGEVFEGLGGAEREWRGNSARRHQWRGGGELRAVERRARARLKWGALL